MYPHVRQTCSSRSCIRCSQEMPRHHFSHTGHVLNRLSHSSWHGWTTWQCCGYDLYQLGLVCECLDGRQCVQRSRLCWTIGVISGLTTGRNTASLTGLIPRCTRHRQVADKPSAAMQGNIDALDEGKRFVDCDWHDWGNAEEGGATKPSTVVF